MIKLLNTILFLFLIHFAQADCGRGNLSFWPQNSTLKSGQAIIVTGSGYLQQFIDSIGTKYHVYLLSNTQKIRLIVNEVNKSGRSQTQVILFPEDSLVIGEEYQLIYDPLEKDVVFSNYNYTTKSRENIKWKIIEPNTNTKSFNWETSPKATDVEYFEMGCGPIIYQIFDLGISDTNSVLLRAVLIDKATQKSTTYVIERSNSTVYVGHGMCGGAFNIELDKTYTIKFEYLDLFSLKPLATSKRVEFTVRKPLE